MPIFGAIKDARLTDKPNQFRLLSLSQGLIDLCRLDNTHSNCNGRWLGRGRLHLGKSGQELLDLALLVWMMLEVRARHARYSCTVSNK